jgi:hypothetical protein
LRVSADNGDHSGAEPLTASPMTVDELIAMALDDAIK